MTEEKSMSGPEEPDKERQESPNGANDDTDWLDELGKEPTRIYDEDDALQEKDQSLPGKEHVGDEIPDWLAGDLEQEVSEEEAIPNWLKDEMAAEEGNSSGKQASDQGLDIEDTAVFNQPLDLPDEEIPGWLSDEVEADPLSDAATEGADELSWLDQIAAGEGAAIEEPPTLSWDEQELDAPEEMDDSAEEDMTWLDDMSTLPAVTAEELAAKSGDAWPSEQTDEEHSTPTDTLDEEIPLKESSFDDEVIDVEADEMQAVEESPVDLSQSGGVSHIEPSIDETIMAMPDSDDSLEDSPESVPEDPDEAMAWLERLAARQGAPAEELPSITEETLSMSVVDAGEMPEDPDEAMAWLEKMAGEQEEPDEEMVAILQDVEDETEEEELEKVDEAIEGAVAEADLTPQVDEDLEYAVSGLEGAELPGDMDEALSWLEDMILEKEAQPLEEGSPVIEDDLVEEDIAEISAEKAVADEELVGAEGEIPVDISMEGMVKGQLEEDDDAMAWLEQLAARQGASLDELTTVDSELEEPEAPEWLREEMDEALQEVVETEPEATEELAIEEVEAESAMDFHEVEIPTLEEEPLKLDSELAEIFEDEGLTEPDSTEPVFDFQDIPEMEDWSESAPSTGALDPSVVDEATQEDLAWMETLGEVDPDSWLEAEVEATSPDLIIPEIPSDSGQAIEPDVPDQGSLKPETEGLQESVVDSVELLSDVDGILDAQHLQVARGAIAAGNLDTALNELGVLLRQGEGLPYLIAEIQTSISSYGEQPRLQRLLGDAYVQNGQLKKAIEVYRQALDNL